MGDTEVALAARALGVKSDAAAADEHDEVGEADVVDASKELAGDPDSTGSPTRFPYLAVLGGAAGVGLLVLLVVSVLTVSDDSKRPAVEMQRAPSTSPAPSPAVTAAPKSTPVPAIPAPAPPEPTPSDVPTAQNQPTVKVTAPQAPLTAETMRPNPPFSQPPQMFPRLHRWFPNLFAEG
jgi:hypothetical protein